MEALKVARKIPMGTKTDKGEPDYQYIASYVDDLTIVTLEPEKILDELKGHGYKLKGGGAPDTFLGATIGQHTFSDGSSSAWYQSAEDYLKNAINSGRAAGISITHRTGVNAAGTRLPPRGRRDCFAR
jgi:hypothetical protein